MNWPPVFSRYGVTLRPLAEDMLETVRQWRNDPEIAQHMLNQELITAEKQRLWFQELVDDRSRAYWVAWFKNEPIGVASLVNIDRVSGTVEPGMYIYPQIYRNNIVPFCVAFALNDMAFEVLGLTCLKGKIFPENEASIRFHQKCGYSEIPSDDEKLLRYELVRANYESARAPIALFIRY